MNKVALGGCRIAAAKNAELVAHARRAPVCNAQAHVHRLRERQGREIIAMGFHHQADGGAIYYVQGALLYQIGVHRSVKPAVINHVVHVPVGVVVHPARRNSAPNAVGAAGVGVGFMRFGAHRDAKSGPSGTGARPDGGHCATGSPSSRPEANARPQVSTTEAHTGTQVAKKLAHSAAPPCKTSFLKKCDFFCCTATKKTCKTQNHPYNSFHAALQHI